MRVLCKHSSSVERRSYIPCEVVRFHLLVPTIQWTHWPLQPRMEKPQGFAEWDDVRHEGAVGLSRSIFNFDLTPQASRQREAHLRAFCEPSPYTRAEQAAAAQ